MWITTGLNVWIDAVLLYICIVNMTTQKTNVMTVNEINRECTIVLDGFAEMQVIYNSLQAYLRQYGRTQFVGENMDINPDFNEHHFALIEKMADQYHAEYCKDV